MDLFPTPINLSILVHNNLPLLRWLRELNPKINRVIYCLRIQTQLHVTGASSTQPKQLLLLTMLPIGIAANHRWSTISLHNTFCQLPIIPQIGPTPRMCLLFYFHFLFHLRVVFPQLVYITLIEYFAIINAYSSWFTFSFISDPNRSFIFSL